MKRVGLFCLMVTLTASLYAADLTNPGDQIVGLPNDGRWPAAEAPQYVIDNNVNTKYLHFFDNTPKITGFAVKPNRTQTIAGGMTFTSANDSAGRDPRTWELSGSNTGIDGPWTVIASGQVTDFIQTAEWPRLTKTTTPMRFVNTTPYDYYRVMFPTIRTASENMMQIAEVEILEAPANGWPPEVNAGPDRLLRLPDNILALTGTISDFDTPIASITHTWIQDAGPGAVNFNGTEGLLNATATFPAVAGLYTLRLQARDDKGNDGNDIMQVRVWDPAKEDILVGHWKFNEGTGTTTADSSGNNNKGLLGFTVTDLLTPAPAAPTFDAGWIPAEAPNNFGMKFVNGGYVEIKTDPNFTEGDLNNLQWSISIASWFKADDWIGNHRILQKGAVDNQFRLLAEGGRMVFHLAGVGRLETNLPTAGTWHHVAATFDGNTMKMFIDGWLAGSLAAVGRIGITTDAMFLGTKNKTVTVNGDYFKGMLDDVRVYSYPLSDTAIQDLAKMGQNVPPVVSIVQPADLVLSVRKYIQMNATAIDLNNDTINYKWTATDPSITFSPSDSVEDPKAEFTKDGTFTLRLTVNDGKVGLDGSIYAEVTVKVTNPVCADVIAAGLTLFGDYNKDCHVTLADFAAFAANWLKCNDPRDATCENPFATP
jgi:hypothetical protein